MSYLWGLGDRASDLRQYLVRLPEIWINARIGRAIVGSPWVAIRSTSREATTALIPASDGKGLRIEGRSGVSSDGPESHAKAQPVVRMSLTAIVVTIGS